MPTVHRGTNLEHATQKVNSIFEKYGPCGNNTKWPKLLQKKSNLFQGWVTEVQNMYVSLSKMELKVKYS